MSFLMWHRVYGTTMRWSERHPPIKPYTEYQWTNESVQQQRALLYRPSLSKTSSTEQPKNTKVYQLSQLITQQRQQREYHSTLRLTGTNKSIHWYSKSHVDAVQKFYQSHTQIVWVWLCSLQCHTVAQSVYLRSVCTYLQRLRYIVNNSYWSTAQFRARNVHHVSSMALDNIWFYVVYAFSFDIIMKVKKNRICTHNDKWRRNSARIL